MIGSIRKFFQTRAAKQMGADVNEILDRLLDVYSDDHTCIAGSSEDFINCPAPFLLEDEIKIKEKLDRLRSILEKEHHCRTSIEFRNSQQGAVQIYIAIDRVHKPDGSLREPGSKGFPGYEP